MPTETLPEAMYVNLYSAIRADMGGQTKAMLLRNRAFTEHAGVDTTILTIDHSPVYPVERQLLAERGELIPGMRLLNIFESYRDEVMVDGPPLAESLPDLGEVERIDVPHPDGSVYYTGYRPPRSDKDLVRDYRRPDGSIYLRVPGPDRVKDAVPVTLTDRAGRPVISFGDFTGWRRHWLARVAGDAGRVVVISDSRSAMSFFWPMPDDRFLTFVVFHNPHLRGERRWDDPLDPTFTWAFDHVDDLDGIVTLTTRQADDIAERVGRRSNLFSVANPVVMPDPPDPTPVRDRARFAIVCRIEAQKRLNHAVRAFAAAVGQRPEARLHIYGRGKAEAELAQRISELELDGRVIFEGWRPDAKDQLWTATGFLLSSRFEGYPLATLESLSRGCPVVAYDIKYGPREQIDDGVDGFLIDDGDIASMAERIVELIDHPELVARMSVEATKKAAAHSVTAFVGQWAELLQTAIRRHGQRVHLELVRARIDRIGHRSSRLPYRLLQRSTVDPASASLSGPGEFVVQGDLVVRGDWPRGTLKHAKITLTAVGADGATVPLPMTVDRQGRRFAFASQFDLGLAVPPGAGPVMLRLRLVMRNAGWETIVSRPGVDLPAYEVAYDADQRVILHRGRSSTTAPDRSPARD